MKRLLSVLLSVVMVVSLLQVSVFAASNQFQIKLTSSTNLTEMKSGDTVKVQILSPQSDIQNFNILTAGITFDQKKVELTERKSSGIKACYAKTFTSDSEFESYTQTMTSVANANKSGKVTIATTNSNTSGYTLSANTVLLEATFKVKSDVTDEAAFGIALESIYQYKSGASTSAKDDFTVEAGKSITIPAPPVPATKITLNQTSLNLDTKSADVQLTATLTPADSTDNVTWASSNTSVVTVSDTGLVHVVGAGDAVITARVNATVKAECTVHVASCNHTGSRKQVAEKAATCTVDGEKAHWVCENCGAKFMSQNATTPATDAQLTIARLEHVWGATTPEEPATCTETGTKAYKVCTRTCCTGKKFDVKTGEEITNLVIPALGHQLKKVAGTPATCTTDGTKEYWECQRENCHDKFLDNKGMTAATAENTKIPALGHKMVKTEAKAPTCTATGNKEYYTCSVCKGIFADEQGKQPTTLKDQTIPVANHTESSKYVAGATQHWTFCTVCGEVLTKADHIYTSGKCVCGATNKDAAVDANHKNHKAGQNNYFNETKHWADCGDPNCAGHVGEANHSLITKRTIVVNGKTYEVKECVCGYVTRVEVKNNTTGTTTGTNPNAKNPYEKNDTTKKDDGKKVESGKTFDAGIALYVGLSVLSVTGGALVIGKKKEF